jgi:hypothetical protein
MTTDIENDRLGLLRLSDWTQLPDVPITEAQRAEAAAYRQALRDADKQEGWPFTWTPPVLPEFMAGSSKPV